MKPMIRPAFLAIFMWLLVGNAAQADLANISTRGFVGTGEQALLAGAIVFRNDTIVLARARGPSLANFGLTGVLGDTVLRVILSNGGVLCTNDDLSQISNNLLNDINNLGLLPQSPFESVIVLLVPAGASFTVELSGFGGSTGLGIVELFELGPGNAGGVIQCFQ